ncbi:MAG: fumarylacetoacetate hydrolase family protein [bacterium]|jgi:2-keto-4-pentenoate hydratase/2-oxohepta-3-ene-1,7-dioic acid hydratase in catechol pathway
MKFVRYLHGGKECYGVWQDDMIEEITGDIYSAYSLTGNKIPFDAVKLLAPVTPSKIVAIGLNYLDHVKEGGQDREPPKEPLIFLKAPSCLCAHGDAIVLPKQSQLVHYEAEIGVVIKDRIKRVTEANALQHVLGYTCANDVSERIFQRNDGQWARSKSFDTFCPVGPAIVTDVDPHDLKISLSVNGKIRQNSTTGNMIFNVDYLVSYVSQQMTLLPGDIIITGTPSGVGQIFPGDVVRMEIENIGVLENPVVAEE